MIHDIHFNYECKVTQKTRLQMKTGFDIISK